MAGSVKGSVVKITGIAPSCSRQIDGSGFVYARERVMTNAHVLAGVGHPKVYAEGRVYAAHPVYIDEETDVAILDVPGLPEVPLAFAPQPAATGSDTIIMGYPGGGSLYIGPARVRDRGEISGPDFRDRRTVVRDVYALYGTVRAGNSGGPLLSTDGKVLGVVFASSVDDPDDRVRAHGPAGEEGRDGRQHRHRPGRHRPLRIAGQPAEPARRWRR